jgi:hypothetical protein
MKSKLLTLLIASSMLSLGAVIVGCDDTLSKDESVQRKSDGTVVHDKTEVSRQPDGTIVKEETHTKDKP